jgi:ADP-ribose pyrophosphatase YjhB (NUDIX family)
MTTPAEQLALWADMLRDMASTGLTFAPTIYDTERYEAIRHMAAEMAAFATGEPIEQFDPLRAPALTRFTPFSVGDGAVIDDAGRVLLIRRSDNRHWALPGGAMEVGETAAHGVAREILEESGVYAEPVALVGLFDVPPREGVTRHHLYSALFLCRLVAEKPPEAPSHAHESVDQGWFSPDELPEPISERQQHRIAEAFRVWRGDPRAYFDKS